MVKPVDKGCALGGHPQTHRTGFQRPRPEFWSLTTRKPRAELLKEMLEANGCIPLLASQLGTEALSTLAQHSR